MLVSTAERVPLTTRPCTGPSCDAHIADVTLLRKDGQRVRHVFDPEPVPGGQYRIEPTLLGELEATHDASLTTGYVSHFATCPNSPQFRGTR